MITPHRVVVVVQMQIFILWDGMVDRYLFHRNQTGLASRIVVVVPIKDLVGSA
jgi:hypothetical protein